MKLSKTLRTKIMKSRFFLKYRFRARGELGSSLKKKLLIDKRS